MLAFQIPCGFAPGGRCVAQCDGEGEAKYKAFRALAWFFVLVYPIGVPCFFGYMLYVDYHRLFDLACATAVV